MILASFSSSAEGCFPHRRVTRNTVMMAACRFPRPFRVILFFVVVLGVPKSASPTGLEEPAKEFARRIAAAVPPGETASCEVRNISSLRPAEAAQIEGSLKAQLQERSVRLVAGDASIKVLVTLSENFNALVWTGEIRQGGASHVILASVSLETEKTSTATTMPVAIRSEKFWQGPERILDAGEMSNGFGKSWLVLLLPDGVSIRDQQSGLVNTLEIESTQSASRDPWGNLNVDAGGETLGVFLASRMCAINLERPDASGCTPKDGGDAAPLGGRIPVMIDIAPPGPPPPAKGTVIQMQSVCGGGSQFLATGARDYTQTDSVQVFQVEPGGAVAVSGELNFPGPITALHATSATPRAVVHNLATGNYEAYRLSFSCAQ
jgi:hypothetical protein